MSGNPFEENLDKNAANYAPMTPISFLARTAAVFPERTSVIDGDRRFTWAETRERCHRLASALTRRGIGKGCTVALILPNITAAFEASLAVPMTGGVLNAMNIRLDAPTIAFILDHGEARVLLTDTEFAPVMREALKQVKRDILVIDVEDPAAISGERLGEMEYEAFLATGDPDFAAVPPDDEWNSIALNYTSGTTGNPKGVVYHHRGAYLNALGNALVWGMAHQPIYLWTLPMFHCNGWCFPWTVTMLGGTHVCLRRTTAKGINDAIADHGVTHLCGAPIIMLMMLNASEEESRNWDHQVQMMTAGSAPPAAVIEGMEAKGVKITHVYGLTEVYGPAVVCEWHEEWNGLPINEQAQLKARQGVRYPVQEGLMVAAADTLEPVPQDGQTMGEIFMRGNIVMKGYLKNRKATDDAFRGGWFHTGDLGVWHEDGYVELKDRSKDIIISGGENISSIEVEGVLHRHPAVLDAAVVARPDEKWGETPCAFVTLKKGATVGETDLIVFCKENMAHFKAPKTIVFGELPKTSTGKVQKSKLRDQVKAL